MELLETIHILFYKANNVKFNRGGDSLVISVNGDIYTSDILHKCFYWYSSEYVITISKFLENEIEVNVRPTDQKGLTDECVEILERRITKDLIDFKLRDIVSKETKTIRELLTAKAFANYNSEIKPETEVSDPVGFNVEMI